MAREPNNPLKSNFSTFSKEHSQKIEAAVNTTNSAYLETPSFGNQYFFEQVNDIQTSNLTVADLFVHYETAGFIYPQKKERIAPYLKLITKNWTCALQAGKAILWTAVFQRPHSNHTATLSIWRTTHNSWFAQHLTSTGFPAGVVSVLLNTQAEGMLRKDNNKSCQMWYSPANKYASKLYGTMVDAVGENYASNRLFGYYAVPSVGITKPSDNIEVIQCSNNNGNGIYDLAVKERGKIYADAEELGEDDIELRALNDIYSRVGLQRKRMIWVAFSSLHQDPVGAAICYRGPFGFNFSLLENRCDLLTDENLDEETTACVCRALISHAATAYLQKDVKPEYPLDYIPIVTSGKAAFVLKNMGANLMREYHQCICMQEGFTKYYQHIENTFDVIVERMKKRALKN
ncbi:hypothetical protein QUF75_13515 [Desulfococcaceae bacterium HSG7]|nr:hypothetical protein [Desulfococcaceae bacterium HSG7]